MATPIWFKFNLVDFLLIAGRVEANASAAIDSRPKTVIAKLAKFYWLKKKSRPYCCWERG